jgi:hypothetical protein
VGLQLERVYSSRSRLSGARRQRVNFWRSLRRYPAQKTILRGRCTRQIRSSLAAPPTRAGRSPAPQPALAPSAAARRGSRRRCRREAVERQERADVGVRDALLLRKVGDRQGLAIVCFMPGAGGVAQRMILRAQSELAAGTSYTTQPSDDIGPSSSGRHYYTRSSGITTRDLVESRVRAGARS